MAKPNSIWTPTRRTFIKGTVAAGVGTLFAPLDSLFAAEFPSRDINVVVPTREGGEQTVTCAPLLVSGKNTLR